MLLRSLVCLALPPPRKVGERREVHDDERDVADSAKSRQAALTEKTGATKVQPHGRWPARFWPRPASRAGVQETFLDATSGWRTLPS